MKFKEIIETIEKLAPPSLGEDWDNSGVQVNAGKNEIGKVLICLEIDGSVIDEAVSIGADMIISHHPITFLPLGSYRDVQNPPVHIDGDLQAAGERDLQDSCAKDAASEESRLTDSLEQKIGEDYIIKLIENKISAYSAHIPFDAAPLGNNYYIAKLLKLVNARKASPVNNPENIPGLIADVQEQVTLSEFLEDVRVRLELSEKELRGISGKPEDLAKEIKRAAICTGSGSDFLETSYKEGCDVLITGDLKYHKAREALALGVNVIDAGHYGTEKHFIKNFGGLLKEMTQSEGLEVALSSVNIDPFML